MFCRLLVVVFEVLMTMVADVLVTFWKEQVTSAGSWPQASATCVPDAKLYRSAVSMAELPVAILAEPGEMEIAGCAATETVRFCAG